MQTRGGARRRATFTQVVAATAACLILVPVAACDPHGSPPGAQPTASSTDAAPASPAAGAVTSGPPAALMAAADGGPMLWPIYQETSAGTAQVGFVDVDARVVVPRSYSGFAYCDNASGRASLVLAFSDQSTDVYDLTGHRKFSFPGSYAWCVGDSYAVVESVPPGSTEGVPAISSDAVYDLRSGDAVVPSQSDQHVEAIGATVLEVVEPDSSSGYFFDAVTGTRTPHPGDAAGNWVPGSSHVSVPDNALIPACVDVVAPGGGGCGYLSRNGTWALEPTFADTAPFIDGYAIVELVGADSEPRQVFVDTSFRQVGPRHWSISVPPHDEWQSPTAPVPGYVVVDATGTASYSDELLGPTLSVLVPEVKGQLVQCTDTDCLVWPADSKSPRYVHLPDGRTSPIPSGITIDLPWGDIGSGLLGGYSGPSDARAKLRSQAPYERLADIATGKVLSLPTDACLEVIPVAGAYVVCVPGDITQGSLADVSGTVMTRDGSPTTFTTMLQPRSDSPYLWVRSGAEQGYVDMAGHWLYEERTPSAQG